MTKKYRGTDQDFAKLVSESVNFSDLIKKMGLKVYPGNFQTCHKLIARLGLSTEHFSQNYSTSGNKTYPIEDYLTNQRTTSTNRLKLRLIKEGILQHKCYHCGITEWNGQPTPIQLEHIDGDSRNNSLENLTILCPNCHAQTETYCGKNKSFTYDKGFNPCKNCKKKTKNKSFCSYHCSSQYQHKQ